jgi:hypothetical protein
VALDAAGKIGGNGTDTAEVEAGDSASGVEKFA